VKNTLCENKTSGQAAPNDALHTDSAITLRFYIEDHWRGAGEKL
jgi:hypothetical protein